MKAPPLSPGSLWLLKNLPITANVAANVMGMVILDLVQGDFLKCLFPRLMGTSEAVEVFFNPVVFGLAIYTALVYERPIRKTLKDPQYGGPPEPTTLSARKRLLNMPYFYMGLNMAAWGLAAVVFPGLLAAKGAPGALVLRSAAQSLIIGLTSSTLAFFLVEAILQNFYIPRFFPQGGVFATRGVLRTRIVTRILALFVIAGFVPGIISLLMAGGIHHLQQVASLSPEQVMQLHSSAMVTNSLVFTFTGLVLAVLVGLTLARPFRGIVAALRDLSQGHLDTRVPVRSNDEVGYTCEVINQMAVGLRERERMARGLCLAGEVQRSMLPTAPPDVPGLDLAGTSLPCDETGGDYFDFVLAQQEEALLVVVGDVSGHGVSSALLMTTVRAMVRMRAAMPGSGHQKLNDINRQLCRDVGDSGNFMTLFLLSYKPETRRMVWVRAGHDPALVYDPADGSFTELMDGGPALGIIPQAEYAGGRGLLKPGQVLLIGTDGIWETRAMSGEMFGKQRVRDILVTHAHLPAKAILDALLERVAAFRGRAPTLDDVTAVVIKAL